MKILLSFMLLSLFFIGDIQACGGKKVQSLQIERTTCYGKCPAYRLGVNKDGSLGYEGKMFVENEGFYKAQVSEEDVADIFDYIKTLNLNDYEEKYDRGITDVPSLILTFNKKNGDQQVITIRSGGPEELKRLAEMVDRYRDAEWQPVKSPEQELND